MKEITQSRTFRIPEGLLGELGKIATKNNTSINKFIVISCSYIINEINEGVMDYEDLNETYNTLLDKSNRRDRSGGKETMDKCKQGVFVRNVINGTEGLVVGKMFWIYGCEKVVVSPKKMSENYIFGDSYYAKYIISEEFLELTGEPSNYEQEFVKPDIEKWFGKKCRDKVTGLEGICIACTTTLFSADQYALERLNKKGRPEHEWFDEGRLEIIGDGVKVKDVESSRPGGSFLSLPSFALPTLT